ncbi:hypothetical protein BKA69DRAFT_1104260 [Paraphysoderma sedebokerense]|nr:hypothetical protein BKA69DRAFT_1104260 [Paraphysoderma sedebokerense]
MTMIDFLELSPVSGSIAVKEDHRNTKTLVNNEARDAENCAVTSLGLSLNTPIGVLGTGRMGKALVKRLIISGFNDVMLGSRDAAGKTICEDTGSRICSVASTIQRSSIIILAVPASTHEGLLQSIDQSSLIDKIIIDPSNPATKPDYKSNTTSTYSNLTRLCPQSHIIKAFSNIGAYVLEREGFGEKVYVLGENCVAISEVESLIQRMSMVPLYIGGFEKASMLERKSWEVFDNWRRAFTVSLIVFLFFAPYTIVRYNVYKNYPWHYLPLRVMNKVVASVGLTLFGLVHIPSVLALAYRLAFTPTIKPLDKTRLPKILVTYLDIRKYLGLIGYAFLFIHVLMSMICLGPAYYSKLYEPEAVKMNASRFNWVGESSLFFGVIGMGFYTVMSINSLPSINSILSWREHMVVFSGLGWFALFFGATHVCLSSSAFYCHARGVHRNS